MQCIFKTLARGRGEITGVSGDVREESSEKVMWRNSGHEWAVLFSSIDQPVNQ